MNRSSFFPFGALCAALLLSANLVQAQSNAKPPTQMTYQGFLTDGNGLPFGSTTPVNKTVIFRIYDALTGGALKWSSQQVVTVDKGYFSVLLGQGSSVGSEPFNADLTGVFTGPGASDRYLELTADGTIIAPRLRFLPAPSAMLAKSATELLDPVSGASSLSISGGNLTVGGNLNVNNVTASGTVSGGTVNSTADITASRNISANGNLSAVGSVFSGTVLKAASSITSHGQGAYLEWNREVGGGMTYVLNQKGGGGGGIVFGEVSTGNDVTERMRINSSGNVGVGTTSPTSKLHVSGDVTASSFVGNGTIPIGGIIMWSGATTAIPAGWRLCDGTEGTPNLRDRFVLAAGGSYAVGAIGGSTSQSLNSGNLPSFNINYNDIYHSENGGTVTVPSNRGSGDTDGDNRGYDLTRTATYSGSANAFSIMPPYYALAFIMRVQ